MRIRETETANKFLGTRLMQRTLPGLPNVGNHNLFSCPAPSGRDHWKLKKRNPIRRPAQLDPGQPLNLAMLARPQPLRLGLASAQRFTRAILYTVCWILYTAYCFLDTASCLLCTVYCVLYTVPYTIEQTIQTIKWPLCPSILHSKSIMWSVEAAPPSPQRGGLGEGRGGERSVKLPR